MTQASGVRKNNAYFQELAGKTLERRHTAILQDITSIEPHLRTLVRTTLTYEAHTLTDTHT